jgi:hypothetical protein
VMEPFGTMMLASLSQLAAAAVAQLRG